MEIVINDLEYCKVGIKYQADPDTVKNKRNLVAREMAKSYVVKGFRKGKASPEVIKITFPNELSGYLKQELLNQAYSDSINEKGIKPFGGPMILSVTLDGNNFETELSVHTLPNFELKEYKGFEIPKYSHETTIDDFSQKILQNIRMEHAESIPFNDTDFVQMGDDVALQYTAILNNEEVSDFSSSGSLLKIGQTNIPGFDDNILGMTVDQEKEFSLNIPDTFNSKYVGKSLLFKVKLLSGSKSIPAALDDALAIKLGLSDFLALESQAKSVAGAKIQQAESAHYQDQVSRRLIAGHDFQVPEWIAIPEAKIQMQLIKKDFDSLTDVEKVNVIKDCEASVKLSLVLSKIQDTEIEAQLTQEELFGLAKQNISQFTNRVDDVINDLNQKGQMQAFLSRIKDEYTLQFIIKTCTFVE